MGNPVTDIARDTAAFFTGGTSGMNVAKGEAPTANTIAADAAGLTAGSGIAASGVAAGAGAGAGAGAAGANTISTMPPAILSVGEGGPLMPAAAVPGSASFAAATGGPAPEVVIPGAAGSASGAAPGAPSSSGASTSGSALDTAKTVATVLGPIASMAAAGAGINASKKIGQLTGQPVVAPPVTMPTVGSADTLNAMRSNIQEQIARRGRAATILTDASSDKLGG